MKGSFQTLTTPRGKKLEYFLGLPDEYDSGKTYRVILAVPPGPQDKSMVEEYLDWIDYFTKRGWIMVCPVTPDGRLFFQGSERYLPYLMDHIQNEIELHGGKFFLLGVSNGGVSAFRIATLHPERFHSITVMPGWPKPADQKRLESIVNIPVNFVVGELDERWRAKSEEFSAKLSELGCDVFFEVIPAQGHIAFHIYNLSELEKLIERNTR